MVSNNIGEEAISKAAEIGLESQLDEADSLDVEIHTNPLDLMQGNIDSVSIQGEGLVMNKELRTEKLRIETNSISIDSIKAAMGNIELTQTTDARMLVILKEGDLQNALNSQYIQQKLEDLTIDCEGEKVNAKIREVNLSLLDNGKIGLNAKVYLAGEDEANTVTMTATPEIDNQGSRINLKSVEYDNSASSEREIARAIIASTEEILDLRNFELDTMSLRVRKLDVKLGKLTIEADAEIKDFPQN